MAELLIPGDRYGRLVVVHHDGRAKALMRCDCGVERMMYRRYISGGRNKSCGCVRAEKVGNLRRTHNSSRGRLYNIWKKMKYRCENERDAAYKDYGGRGIFVCEEWKKGFEPFKEWSETNGYRKDLTIDRIDNDGPYAPWNCRWADWITQGSNKRNTVRIPFNGKMMTVTEVERITGKSRYYFYHRIRIGMPPNQIACEFE